MKTYLWNIWHRKY